MSDVTYRGVAVQTDEGVVVFLVQVLQLVLLGAHGEDGLGRKR